MNGDFLGKVPNPFVGMTQSSPQTKSRTLYRADAMFEFEVRCPRCGEPVHCYAWLRGVDITPDEWRLVPRLLTGADEHECESAK